jgi:PadR family transcriptional regulator, regulatory protein PadR
MEENPRTQVDALNMPPPIKLTVPFLKTITVFINSPSRQYSGADICRETKLFSGTVYPLLYKLEEKGWIKGAWEEIDPHKEGRPKKRLYQITSSGVVHGRKLVTEHFPPLVQTAVVDVGAA